MITRFRAVSAIMLLALLAAQVWAQSSNAGSPQSTPKPDSSKEAFIVERSITKVNFEADGSGTRETTVAFRIQSQAGIRALAVLTVAYTSANDTVEFDYVRVRKPDGSVIATPEYNIQDMPAEVTRTAPMYSDIHEKHVTVKGLDVGDVLEYVVRYRTVKPQVPGQFWFEYTFPKDTIAKDEQLEISVPKDKYVKVASPELAPQIKDDGARRIYSWKTSNLQHKDSENKTFQPEAPKPSVQVTTFKNWEDVGRWYGDLQRPQAAVTPAIQAKANELTKGLTTDEDKMRAIYDFVSARYHYVSLSFGIGRYQPHAAQEVMENEYGDCKDKHTLLAALLKAAGYDAWPALINFSGKIDADVPSPGQFNHLITVVPVGIKIIWLDTTPEVAPFGLLLANLRNKKALVIPTDKSASLGKFASLMDTPMQPPSPSHQTFTAKGRLTADGTLTANVHQNVTGDQEVLYRIVFRNTSASQWQETGQRISELSGFGGQVSEVSPSAVDEIEKPFQLDYVYTRKTYGDWNTHQIPAPVPWFGIENIASEEKRPEQPVFIGAVGDLVYQANIDLPPGLAPKYTDKKDLVEDFAEYHATYSIDAGVLSVTRRLILKTSEVPVRSWDTYKAFCKSLADERDRFINLNTGTSTNAEADRLYQEGYDALQQRDYTKAAETFHRLIELSPKYPNAHGNLGVAEAAKHNKLDAGISELLKEEELNPNEPFWYDSLASFYMSAKRNEEAMTQLRALLKIDPSNREGALKLAHLLSASKKYSEAIAVLQKSIELSPDSALLQTELGYLYLQNGEKEKALPLLQKTLAKETNYDALNNIGYTLADMNIALDQAQEYLERALHQIEAASAKQDASEDERLRATRGLGQIWDSVGWLYFRQGKYDQAQRFLHAAWLLSQDPTTGDHLGQLYERQGKKSEAAHVYKLAYASFPLSRLTPGEGDRDREAILEHYKRLMGKDANPEVFSITRKADGTYTAMPGEELSRMREVKISTTAPASADAVFSIVLSPGKVENVKYVSGAESLQPMLDHLSYAKLNPDFPDSGPVSITRRGMLVCTKGSGCNLVLLPPDSTHD
jgi:tetratricopeptide (TPR) repeat protein/transglutaminase-like putative cysteine protease